MQNDIQIPPQLLHYNIIYNNRLLKHRCSQVICYQYHTQPTRLDQHHYFLMKALYFVEVYLFVPGTPSCAMHLCAATITIK